MNWTSVYLKTNSLNVFILGTGEVATRRADKFLSHGASVKLAGDSLDSSIEEKGAILVSTEDVDELVNWADLVIIASGDRELSNYVASIADNKLLNRADFPNEGNLIVPTSFNIGNVEISIFTNGKSPLMARQLRKRIQEIITDEDLIKMELQDYARSILKEKVDDQKERRTYLYTIFEDKNIHNLIEKNKIDEAKSYIYNLINEN
ncbi:MAG: bifunctional precorrin-2 dehydrogenase/sirohydrochlorin ferrochelatase [Methanobrevibacter woesei]|uniref:precorrin-2 dehydrogenase/sirohydrochlorin ferrochelatase family protein n=1 Tax=Methanobrevibacter woesei TaxID=190976 RepID=UPI001F894AC3|nr:bifunctional precorrin-2 dehydrogenase/sirohydrochlorin ferrochelatase [Methanobrevibacter woesei]MCC9261896.1 bifunctional precorrin-2 dehydrogenase/sirohydrochlorin ferrochelatase [Methanobrevibacter woesei]